MKRINRCVIAKLRETTYWYFFCARVISFAGQAVEELKARDFGFKSEEVEAFEHAECGGTFGISYGGRVPAGP
jgi:hypothetical protein